MSNERSNVVPLYQIQRYDRLKNGSCLVGSVKTVSGIGSQFGFAKGSSSWLQLPARCVWLVNQEVVIELVDEEPTEEMISARERFWERVFAELLPAEESSVRAKRKK